MLNLYQLLRRNIQEPYRLRFTILLLTGAATMIIVGELEGLPINAGNYSEVEQIPDEFKGVYNVRLTKEVIINPAEINTQPIKFYSSPRLTAVEKKIWYYGKRSC